MRELVEMIIKETGLSEEKAEKVVKIVEKYLEKPLSKRTLEELATGNVTKEDLSEDKQPFIIP